MASGHTRAPRQTAVAGENRCAGLEWLGSAFAAHSHAKAESARPAVPHGQTIPASPGTVAVATIETDHPRALGRVLSLAQFSSRPSGGAPLYGVFRGSHGPPTVARVRRVRAVVLVAIVVACGMAADAQAQTSGYAGAVLGTAGLQSYWRLGEPSGTIAAEATGNAPGSYAGGAALGTRGALALDPDTAVHFDGADDELLAPGGAAARTIEGWFDWEGGVAVMRDATSAGGWILAYDNAGRVAYRVGGTTYTTTRA